MTSISIANGKIDCIDESGTLIRSGTAGEDDASIIQEAVDHLTTGGEIVLRAGRYTLTQSIGIHLPITITGEGRGTEIAPPAGDFAFEVFYDGRCPDRTSSSFGVPPAHAEQGMTWEKRREMTGGFSYRPRLHGVHIRHLAIQGDGSGKGIYFATLTESTFRDLWIMNTTDGAALYFKEEVMECVFENLHLSNCGSPEHDEGSITIKSQTGDACNNLRFRDIYVIFPPYIGILIGSKDNPSHPRLIWFKDCMIHGWHVLTEPAPYDLIDVVKTDPSRGISFVGCRITNGGPDSAYLRVREGRVKLEDSVLGGGRGKHLLVAEDRANLHARSNTFHDADDLDVPIVANQASLIFTGNQVSVRRGDPILDITSPVFAIVTENQFEIPGESRCLRLSDDSASTAGPITVTGNIIASTGGTRMIDNRLSVEAHIVERENVVVEAVSQR